MKINIFRGELTDISTKKEALVLISGRARFPSLPRVYEKATGSVDVVANLSAR